MSMDWILLFASDVVPVSTHPGNADITGAIPSLPLFSFSPPPAPAQWTQSTVVCSIGSVLLLFSLRLVLIFAITFCYSLQLYTLLLTLASVSEPPIHYCLRLSATNLTWQRHFSLLPT
ncbi:hypothetical protein BCR41DRAFT_346486 [Lobosporangium transversale]|uniref:Uncharacterized protein n=1 Tax=Lobosporangium transversale TaxID=64571 RepID=A0A1Y2GY37_9FUNG|nr:hypothetical protein BCR41DRAFT_346486 [Lobosporangium transversale]ORZ27199.1 hypothetical protein BCR41DRAFT_346486 [Lobosporangium transversale]|eukprot:XP_021884926.1 hypothetical protein BCR41DRAFT_346486 [Lobosporangium transversale]